MFISSSKFILIYFFTITFSNKILNYSLKRSSKLLTSILLSLILGIITYILDICAPSLSYLFSLILLCIYTNHFTSNAHIAFISTSISFGISYGIFMLSSFIGLLLLYPFFDQPSEFPYYLLLLLTIVNQICISSLLLKVKRFQKGIPTLLSSKNINIVTISCILLITFLSFKPNKLPSLTITIVTPFIFILTLAFLIYWWQAQITKSYRRSLELRELESMRIEMAELKLEMQKVLEDNERLARISHRDNTLLTSLKNATTQMLLKLDPASAEAMEADKLLRSIEALSADRAPVANETAAKKARVFDTDFSLLDNVLNEMELQSLRDNISFSVHFGTSLEQFIPNTIAEIDVMHTVDDLLKNAFKSTLKQDTRMVQLQFYKLGKHFVIEVADSGIPFELESLVNMGLEKRTTYEDGSGIGLIEIWDIKEKYGATYHLEEYPVAAPFTKRISIILDKKNRYSVRTNRKAELLLVSKRADLQVYDFDEN